MSDLGQGKFDGAWLVQNFENQNPANTLWTKPYNLYSKVDTEAPRYLDFERWWSGHVDLNAEEIQFIVDELFVGNNLAAGRIKTTDGVAIDLRVIRSPIVVFCSWGDNITPPQQALDWILDLYESVDEIRSYGQTIVYAIHETVGHLGIFVSGGVVRKQHGELSSNIELIDTLPPGLYEAVLEYKTEDTANPNLVSGEWVMRCEERTLDDIRSLGGNNAADERRFAAAARISETNLALYRLFAQPMVRAMATSAFADWLRRLHPLRMQYLLASNANPWMTSLEAAAEQVRKNRKRVAPDNPFIATQEAVSRQIVATLDAWRQASEWLAEQTFLAVYGQPALQAAVGIDPAATGSLRKVARDLLHRELVKTRVSEVKSRIPDGGLREAVIRSLLYVGISRTSVDERGFEAVRAIRRAHSDLPLPDFKRLVRDQFYMLLIDTEAALAAIPSMLPADARTKLGAFELIKQVMCARGELSTEDRIRMLRIAALFGIERESSDVGIFAIAPISQKLDQERAS
jgi:hypothetical protein